jgi:hypothetical protein
VCIKFSENRTNGNDSAQMGRDVSVKQAAIYAQHRHGRHIMAIILFRILCPMVVSWMSPFLCLFDGLPDF